MSKRTLWGNVVEFCRTAQGFFKAKQIQQDLETNYRKIVAKQMLQVNLTLTTTNDHRV
jgi:hypothetical protein